VRVQITTFLGADVEEYSKLSESKVQSMEIYCAKHLDEKLSYHGAYFRKIKETGEKLKIQRLICKRCNNDFGGGTVSILPDFLLPRKHYSANEIESVVKQNEEGVAVYDIETEASVPTVRRWLHEMKETMQKWISLLKTIVMEETKGFISEAILAPLPQTEQLSELLDKLRPIKYSGNVLGRANIWLSDRLRLFST